ncbi:PREDICTED: uncharacterized protein LOC109352930 [Lupinus angustifolius]|uniref:uncharacterized protein LOC109352930 n=1 Tax=Lupinus angustifolius TaxID=3871 RepID=UPI00092F1880|nr:PREDICTED: uncharacterized protein LOC109352930 [Lupinus angustifolius]
MKSCGEEVQWQSVIEKILRTLTLKYDHIIVAIEESKNLEDYKIEELQSILEAHEQRLKNREAWRRIMIMHSKQKLPRNLLHIGTKARRRKGSIKDIAGRRKFDKRKVQCYNCRNYGHYAAECKSMKPLSSKDEEARLAQNEGSNDDDQYLLMAIVKNSDESGDFCYLNNGCSNHMTCKKDWFTTLDESRKSKIKFVDHSVVTA